MCIVPVDFQAIASHLSDDVTVHSDTGQIITDRDNLQGAEVDVYSIIETGVHQLDVEIAKVALQLIL